MRSKIPFPTAVFLLCSCNLAYSQQHASRLKLTTSEIIVTPEENVPTRIPLKCDTDGDIYLRGYQLAHPLSAPAVKITTDGKKAIVARLDTDKFQEADVMDSA